MRVRFWGVRGSCPAPNTSDDVSSRLEEALWRLGCEPAGVDLSDREGLRRGFEEAVERLGGLDILVTAHGIGRASDAIDHELAAFRAPPRARTSTRRSR